MSFNMENKKTCVIKPVAKVFEKNSKEPVSECVSSAVNCLLKSDTDMFKSAETIRDLMVLEALSKVKVAEVLGTDVKTVDNKLKLLQLSTREQKYIKNLKYSECTAIKLANLSKQDRKAVFAYCRQNGYDSKRAWKYINAFVKTKRNVLPEKIADATGQTGFAKGAKGKMPLGFFINSIDRVVALAKTAGFCVEKSSSVVPDGVEVVIKVRDDGKKEPTAS